MKSRNPIGASPRPPDCRRFFRRRPVQTRHPQSNRHGFSLIEMMVVMSIIATVVIATFSGLFGIGGFKLNGSGNRISNLAMMARQNSLAKNALTALVMIGNSGTEGDYRAFRLFELVPRTDGQPVSSNDWAPLGNWETTPDGVVADSSSCSFTSSSTQSNPPLPPMTYRDTVANRDTAVTSYLYVIFLPNGGLTGTASPSVRLVQGYHAPGAQVTTYTASKVNGTAADYYQINVLAANGRVKIDRP